jgi:hypothetical protein
LRAPTAWPNDLPPRSCRVCNTHQAPAEGVKCHQCRHSSLAFETLPAETYMYLLGLSLKSLAYFACLPCVPFSPPFLAVESPVPTIGCSSKEAACMLHACCCGVALARGIPWWVCTTLVSACVVHECVRIIACVLPPLRLLRSVFCGHAINGSTSKTRRCQ